MTNLAEFHQQVKLEANKGSRLDSVIPGKVRQAVKWLERNYSFTYMDRYVQFTLDPNANDARVAPLDSSVKSIKFVKLILEDGVRYKDIKRIMAQDTDRIEIGPPTNYWLDGHQWLWFNKTPDDFYTFHMSYVAYSQWPTDPTATHWLIESAEEVLLAKTLMLMGPGQREDWEAVYSGMYGDGIQTLITADAELKYQSVSARMQYKPDFIEDPRLEARG